MPVTVTQARDRLEARCSGRNLGKSSDRTDVFLVFRIGTDTCPGQRTYVVSLTH
jgi:hypothetical protein